MRLLISEEAIDFLEINDDPQSYTWESSSIREWLNEEFLEEAIAPDMLDYILDTTVENEKNGCGPDTTDKVFLLSMEEVERYFPDPLARRAKPADNAINRYNEIEVNLCLNEGYGYCWQWGLRSNSEEPIKFEEDRSVDFVFSNGRIYGSPWDTSEMGIRPVIWVEAAGISASQVSKPSTDTGTKFEVGGEVWMGTDYVTEWHWIILDQTEDSLLLMQFITGDLLVDSFHDSNETCDFETCSLRPKMQSNVFVEEERLHEVDLWHENELQRIKSTSIDLGNGKTIDDKVFLLSTDEAAKYKDTILASCDDMYFSYAMGYLKLPKEQEGIWLRTPGTKEGTQAWLSSDGTVHEEGADYSDKKLALAVVWVDVSDLVD